MPSSGSDFNGMAGSFYDSEPRRRGEGTKPIPLLDSGRGMGMPACDVRPGGWPYRILKRKKLNRNSIIGARLSSFCMLVFNDSR